jgi:hypothetical protein
MVSMAHHIWQHHGSHRISIISQAPSRSSGSGDSGDSDVGSGSAKSVPPKATSSPKHGKNMEKSSKRSPELEVFDDFMIYFDDVSLVGSGKC